MNSMKYTMFLNYRVMAGVLLASGWFARIEAFPGDNLADFEAENYPVVLERVSARLKDDPGDAEALFYKAVTLSMMKRHTEALESYTKYEIVAGACRDRTGLYLKALSLYHIRAYAGAQQALDVLSTSFPKSRLAEKARHLALKVEKGLVGGINKENLGWYYERGITRYNEGKPAMAVVNLREFLLLAKRFGFDDMLEDRAAHLALGGTRHSAIPPPPHARSWDPKAGCRDRPPPVPCPPGTRRPGRKTRRAGA